MPSRVEQEHFTKMNRKSANTCLTDMINISIESFKLLLNEINQIENKNSFIIIREDALLSKGAMSSQDHHLILHLCNTDTENTSLLVNNSNISLLFPPDTFMVITFAGALWQALLPVFEAELFSCADSCLLLRDTKHRRAALSRSSTVSCCFHQRGNFFHHYGCLKYKDKEKPKTDPRPGPRLNYDVKIGPIKAQWNTAVKPAATPKCTVNLAAVLLCAHIQCITAIFRRSFACVH